MGGGTDPAPHKCGLVELLIFVSAILAGTACSICSKLLMEQHSAGLDGNENENFAKPLFQTFGMFLGMLFAFPIHWIVVAFRIPFPGYTFSAEDAIITPVHPTKQTISTANNNSTNSNSSGYSYSSETDALLPFGGKKLSVIKETSFASSAASSVVINISDKHQQQQQQEVEDKSTMSKTWMFFFLAIPSIFDLVATGLCMLGLQYLNVSTYQMLRGSGIVFVAIMKQNVLGHRLQRFQWVGVFWNVVSVFLVGGTAMMASHDVTIVTSTDASTAVLGVMFVLSGAFVQALQFVFEEKVMSMEDSVPPLFLIGMEGFWGTFLCVAVLYPLAYLTPGSDHGSYENPYNTFLMIQNSSTIQVIFVFYFLTIFAYNVLACLVTFMLNSVWHAILDNFRPITVWGVDLFIFYVVTHGALGEAWNKWSIMQLVGMFVLLYGTAIYNAPNSGSLRLEGQWWAFGMNYSDEYRELDRQREEEEMDARWEELRRKAKTRTLSSPKMSVHTLMLRGTLGSPKI